MSDDKMIAFTNPRDPLGAHNVTEYSLWMAERIAKLPGATVGDVRAVAGLPTLSGDEALVNGIVLNLPAPDLFELEPDLEEWGSEGDDPA